MSEAIQSSLGTINEDWKSLPVEKRISHSIGRLLVRQAILGQLTGQFRHVIAEPSMKIKIGSLEIEINECPTACTDGETVWYNRKWVSGLSREGLGFLMLHEIGHNILSHHLRRGTREPKRWNTAIDVAVNDMLLETIFDKEPEATLAKKFEGEGLASGVDSTSASLEYGTTRKQTFGKASEIIYTLLPTNAGKGKRGGKGDGSGKPGEGSPGQPKEYGDSDQEGQDGGGKGQSITMTPDELSELLTKARLQEQGKSEQEGINEQGQKVLRVVQSTKMAGTIPQAIQRIVENLLEPQVNYPAVLRELLSRDRRGDYSYANLSRRQEAYPADIRIPGSGTEKGGGKIIVGFDTSGSIYGEKDLINEMMAEVAGMQQDLELELVLLYCDTEIHKVAVFHPDDKMGETAPNDARRVAVGGGGTKFEPVFEWAEKHASDADAIVYFTDLMGSFPANSRIPTIWITFEEGKGPFGKTININRRIYENHRAQKAAA